MKKRSLFWICLPYFLFIVSWDGQDDTTSDATMMFMLGSAGFLIKVCFSFYSFAFYLFLSRINNNSHELITTAMKHNNYNYNFVNINISQNKIAY